MNAKELESMDMGYMRKEKEAKMKNWERFNDWTEAWQYYEKNCVPALTRMEWGRGSWLYMEHIEGESRMDFLRRCGKAYRGSSILTQVGSKELKRLEKQAAKPQGGAGQEGVYRTPKSALDVVMSNPPIDAIAGHRPLDEMLQRTVGASTAREGGEG